MKKLPYLITICLLLNLSVSMAQSGSIGFSYDEAGNRTQRAPLEVSSMSMVTNTDSNAMKSELKEDLIKKQEAIAQSDVKVYPNPAKEIVHIELSGTNESRYILYDLNGKAVLEGRNNSNLVSLDLSALAPGTYFLIVRSAEKETKWRIVKQ